MSTLYKVNIEVPAVFYLPTKRVLDSLAKKFNTKTQILDDRSIVFQNVKDKDLEELKSLLSKKLPQVDFAAQPAKLQLVS